MRAAADPVNEGRLMMNAIAALADLVRHDHGYSKLIEDSMGATPSNSVPWTSIGVALTIVAAAALLLTLHLTRRTHRQRRRRSPTRTHKQVRPGGAR